MNLAPFPSGITLVARRTAARALSGRATLPNLPAPPARRTRGASMPYRLLGHVEAVLIVVILAIAPLNLALKHPGGSAAAAAPAVHAALQPGAGVDGAKIADADADPGEWLSHGRTYSEQRYSPLARINTANVNKLGVAWEYRTYSVRGLEATPLVADGVMFITLAWSKVIALDAATGKPLWSVDTVENHNKVYTITGAPRVVDGLVVIGNGGAEYDARGYVTAYDAATGKQRGRVHVAPADPSKPQESKALTEALKTWDTTGKYKFWQIGGGGAPWNSFAFDPALHLVYFGTGNGNPWNRDIRSPKGGDNLYLSSVIAVDTRSGQMRWHYQTTPGDTWDFDSTADVVLADLTIGGKQRHVLMHAPKNGFFYVLDRATGQLISAEKFGHVTWAKGVDLKTGKPIENPDARYKDKLAVVYPAATGAHNWQPMSYSPQTGLVYIPAMDAAQPFVADKAFAYRPGAWNTGVDFAGISKLVLDLIKAGKAPPPGLGFIKAWDPVKQKEAWQVSMGGSWNSGLLSTAGGLLFGGDAYGNFNAYDAKTGKKLWAIDLKTGILAPAMSYEIGGTQYIALLAGWGGAGGLSAFKDPNTALSKYQTDQGRLFVFKLGGRQQVAAPAPEGVPPTEPPPQTADAKTIEKGFNLYHRTCLVCHGFFAQSEGEVPDLRLVPREIWSQYDDIVLGGALAAGGMPSFKDILSKDDVTAIRAYILDQSHLAWTQGHSAPAKKKPPGIQKP